MPFSLGKIFKKHHGSGGSDGAANGSIVMG